ncbi:MAG: hypothetical protein K0S34_1445 [Bacillales bacterium]|jgi:hypothetical protein|nr:hypothetical protein [Bacillales bacterium]
MNQNNFDASHKGSFFVWIKNHGFWIKKIFFGSNILVNGLKTK